MHMAPDNTTSADAVVISRHFDAPRQLVWQMWTDPDHFAAWYGPTGASVSVAEMDVQVGGRRLVAMDVGPDQSRTRVWFVGEFLEVSEPERLVYTESMSDEHGNVVSPADLGMPDGHPATTQVTIELQALDGETRLTVTHAGVPQDSPGAAGWEMSLDTLARHLAQPGT